MHASRVQRPIRQRLRVALGGVVIATIAASGLFIGPAPREARAALVATGINDSYAVKHDRLAVIPAPGVLGNDLNLLGGATAILVSNVSHGTLDLRPDGGYTYTPAARYVGPDTFRYRPSGVLSTAATVTITVTNAMPVARPDAYSWPAGSTLVVAAPGVLANDSDADGDALAAEMVGGGISGSLTLDANGGLRYTPGGGFSGTATFSYRVWDGVAWSTATTVSLNSVAPPTPSPAPTATPPPTPTPTPLVPVPTPIAAPPLPSVPLPSLPLSGALQPTRTASATPVPSSSPGATRSPASSPTASPGQSGSSSPPPDQTVAAPSGGSGTGGGSPSPAFGASTEAAASGTGGGSPSPSFVGSTGAGRGDPERGIPSISFDEQRLEMAGASIGMFAGIDVWAVPAATLAGPGLLVLIWVALQTAGAIAWMPAVRRLKGKDRRSTRPFRTLPS